MENYLKDLNKLENFREQNLGSGLFGDPNKVHHSQIRRYNLDYVKTAKFNSKSGQFEPFDKRTGTFYNEKDATKFIVENVKKNRKTKFLKETGTETPIADLNYLYAYNKLQRLKSDKETSPVWAIRNSFSPKVEGSDTTLYEQNWLQRIKEKEAEVLKLRSGTKYERQILKELNTKKENYVKPEVKKEEPKVEVPKYEPKKTYEGTFIQGAFVGKETTPKKLKKTDLMINMP